MGTQLGSSKGSERVRSEPAGSASPQGWSRPRFLGDRGWHPDNVAGPWWPGGVTARCHVTEETVVPKRDIFSRFYLIYKKWTEGSRASAWLSVQGKYLAARVALAAERRNVPVGSLPPPLSRAEPSVPTGWRNTNPVVVTTLCPSRELPSTWVSA